MSCAYRSGCVAGVALLSGLPARCSTSAYLAGLKQALAGPGRLVTYIGQAARQILQLEARQDEPLDYSAIPQLDRKATARPLAPAQLAGKRCRRCGATSEAQPGPWFLIREQPYCEHCAPRAAGAAGVGLISGPDWPASSSPAAALPPGNAASRPRPGQNRQLRLKEQPVDIAVGIAEGAAPGLVRVEGAYAVLAGDRPTGMALTPELAVKTGQATGDWSVTHIDTGLAIAGGFSDLGQAERMAALLAHIDWTRPFETMAQAEIAEAKQIIRAYQASLAQAAGDAATRSWRGRELDGQLVGDGFGEVAYAVEDLGEQVRLVGPEGAYLAPRNLIQPLAHGDYLATRLAQPIEPEAGTLCSTCLKDVADGPSEEWYRIRGGVFCDSCAPAAAGQAGYLMPQDWIDEVLVGTERR